MLLLLLEEMVLFRFLISMMGCLSMRMQLLLHEVLENSRLVALNCSLLTFVLSIGGVFSFVLRDLNYT